MSPQTPPSYTPRVAMVTEGTRGKHTLYADPGVMRLQGGGGLVMIWNEQYQGEKYTQRNIFPNMSIFIVLHVCFLGKQVKINISVRSKPISKAMGK